MSIFILAVSTSATTTVRPANARKGTVAPENQAHVVRTYTVSPTTTTPRNILVSCTGVDGCLNANVIV